MKIYVTISLVLLALIINAQDNKNYLLRTSIGYSYHHLDRIDANDGVTSPGLFGEINRSLTWDINAGRSLGNNFMLGLGFGLNTSLREVNPESDVPDISGLSGFSTIYVSIFHSVSKSMTYSPRIYFQYFYHISERFVVSLDLYTRYDYLHENEENSLQTYSLLDSTVVLSNDHSNFEHKRQYLDFGISPSLRFIIVKNFGMEATFGALEYRMKLSDSRAQDNEASSREFMFQLTPDNWRIGFFLQL